MEGLLKEGDALYEGRYDGRSDGCGNNCCRAKVEHYRISSLWKQHVPLLYN
jgi:hypothetical protein